MLQPDEVYTLPKSVWTQDDFELMSWHDVTIHAVTFRQDEFVLDLDYMFACVSPEPPSIYYSSWMSPATLVFHKASDFKAEIDDPFELIIEVTRKALIPPRKTRLSSSMTDWRWAIDLLQGVIEFSSTGFTQYTRRAPVCHLSQRFSTQERGHISFDRPESVG